MHCAQYFVNSSFAPVVSFVDASSLWRMCSRVIRVRVFLSLGRMLFWVIGRLYVVMVRVVQPLPFTPGTSEFP